MALILADYYPTNVVEEQRIYGQGRLVARQFTRAGTAIHWEYQDPSSGSDRWSFATSYNFRNKELDLLGDDMGTADPYQNGGFTPDYPTFGDPTVNKRGVRLEILTFGEPAEYSQPAVARKPRIEIAGGLYHLITRGNNRKRIFQSHDDHLKFLRLLERQKAKLPFYVYAYCLMPNHVHLLAEMRDDPISRVMHGLLTAYSQYHNRKYRKMGHLFQGRYKAILCQSDRYLAELVRYIHLNPVRAKMVARPEDYEYSGHRAYLGTDRSGLLDTEPVLRHFGAQKKRAVAHYTQFVNAALDQQSQQHYYVSAEGRMLGDEEFLDQVKHRIGDYLGNREKQVRKLNLKAILKAAERASGLKRSDFCTNGKSRKLVMIKEAIIVLGYQHGVSNRELAEALSLDPSAVSKRREAFRTRPENSSEMKLLKAMRATV